MPWSSIRWAGVGASSSSEAQSPTSSVRSKSIVTPQPAS